MSQSKKHSHYEITANQIAGLIIGWCLVYFIFPFMGVDTNMAQASASSLMFFFSSYTRAYAIRRIFNKIGASMTTKDKVTPEMRSWFRETFGYMADDESIQIKWDEKGMKC